MTDQDPTPAPADTPPVAAPPPPPTSPGASVGESPLTVGSQGDAFDERPELFVAGAFVGGVVLAQVLRRLGSS
jgi:hypothetical protein